MNILFITKEFSHKSLNKTGGIGRFYSEISEELVSKNHKVFVLGYNRIKFNSTENGISVYFFKKINFNSSLILLSFFVNRFLLIIHFLLFINRNKNKIDVIEMDDPITSYFISFFYKKIPKVIRQHGMPSILSVMYGNKINKFYYFFEKRAHYRANKIIAVSKYVKQLILDLYGEDLTIDVVYNGIHLTKEETENIKTNKRTLLYIAALSEQKGYLELVEIFNEINRKDDSVNLIIIGRESVLKFNSLKFSETALLSVKYIGYLDYSELKKHYESSNVFLNFTRGETFGLTTIEAMSFKLPVIISNVGVSYELVENGISGFIVDVEEIDDVSNLILRILDDTLLQKKMGESGKEFVRKTFSNKILGEKTLKSYKNVQNENGSK